MNLITILPIVKEQINNFGSDAVIKGDSDSGTYDVATGQYVTTTSETNIKILIDVYSSQEVGGDIISGDFKIMVYLDTEPLISDKIVFNGLTYNIINIRPMIAQNILFYYDIHARLS